MYYLITNRENYYGRKVSEEEIMEIERTHDKYNLTRFIQIKDKSIKDKSIRPFITIKTFGELKKYINKIEDIEKMEDALDDDDYVYLYKWQLLKDLRKELKEKEIK